MTVRQIFVTGVITLTAALGWSTNPVLVDNGGSGDFTTIQAAIDSYCAGGANAAEAAPFVINIKAGSGPYDEQVNLDDATKALVGDTTIKSSVSGTKVVVKLRKGVAGTDGLMIFQNNATVKFYDLVFCPSQTTGPTTYLVRVDNNSAHATARWVEFWNCVFTDVGTNGSPLTTDKAGALNNPAATGAATWASGCLSFWPDAGETVSLRCDNCVFYASRGTYQVRAYLYTAGEQAIFNNCLNSYARYTGGVPDGVNGVGYQCVSNLATTGTASWTFSGTDVKAGPLNCNAIIRTGHGIYGNSTSGGAQSVNISNTMICNTVASPNTSSGSTTRGISTGGRNPITLSDVIICVPQYAVVDTPYLASTWNRVTVLTNSGALYLATAGYSGSVTMRDCILSGGGAKIGGYLPSGGVSVDYCGLPTIGADKIGSNGSGSFGTHNRTVDPLYVSKDEKTASFLDVRNGSTTPDGYAGASSTAGNLSGGASFVGDLRAKVVASASSSAVGAITLNTTAGTFPFEWIVNQVAADPSTLGATGVRNARDSSKYFDISYYPATAAPTADVTLPFAGFTGDARIYHYDSTASAWKGPAVTGGSGTYSGQTAASVTHTGITNFSPFSVGDAASAPVSISAFGLE